MKRIVVSLAALAALTLPAVVLAHPLGNFTIDHSSSVVVSGDKLYVHYVLDMAEIPTLQRGPIQTGPLSRKLVLTVDGRRTPLRSRSPATAVARGRGRAADNAVRSRARRPAAHREVVHRATGRDVLRPPGLERGRRLRHWRRRCRLLGRPRRELVAPAAGVSDRRAVKPARSHAGTRRGRTRARTGTTADTHGTEGRAPYLGLRIACHARPGRHRHPVGARPRPLLGRSARARPRPRQVDRRRVPHRPARNRAPRRLPRRHRHHHAHVGSVRARRGYVAAVRADRSRGPLPLAQPRRRADGGRDRRRRPSRRGSRTAAPTSTGITTITTATITITITISSPRSLLAVGVSGGLLPCPSALVVLLAAISLHRTAFGLALVLAFSVGLAITITAIGLVAVLARGVFRRKSFDGRLVRVLPAMSAVAILVAGLVMTARALPTVS